MAISRGQVTQFVIGYFSDHFHMPASYFSEKTDLKKDLLYTNESLIALGKWINQAHWHDAYVMPSEIAGCKTIGNVIDLIMKKVSGK